VGFSPVFDFGDQFADQVLVGIFKSGLVGGIGRAGWPGSVKI